MNGPSPGMTVKGRTSAGIAPMDRGPRRRAIRSTTPRTRRTSRSTRRARSPPRPRLPPGTQRRLPPLDRAPCRGDARSRSGRVVAVPRSRSWRNRTSSRWGFSHVRRYRPSGRGSGERGQVLIARPLADNVSATAHVLAPRAPPSLRAVVAGDPSSEVPMKSCARPSFAAALGLADARSRAASAAREMRLTPGLSPREFHEPRVRCSDAELRHLLGDCVSPARGVVLFDHAPCLRNGREDDQPVTVDRVLAVCRWQRTHRAFDRAEFLGEDSVQSSIRESDERRCCATFGIASIERDRVDHPRGRRVQERPQAAHESTNRCRASESELGADEALRAGPIDVLRSDSVQLRACRARVSLVDDELMALAEPRDAVATVDIRKPPNARMP